MSSRQYTVTVKLDDKGVLSKLNSLGSGSPIGGGGRGAMSAAGGGGGGGIFGKLESLGIGQLVKLTGIGLGIGALVTQTVKSSAQLQGIFKLWETGMMLVFKPFGDFVATLLRPLTIMFLQWAIPFYKDAGKFFKNASNQTSRVFGEQGEDIKNALLAIGQFQITATAGLMGFFAEANKKMDEAWDGFITSLSGGLTSVPTLITDVFLRNAGRISDGLLGIPASIAKVFTDFGANATAALVSVPTLLTDIFLRVSNNIYDGLLAIPGTIADVFTGLASNIASTLSGIPSVIYNAIIGWINSMTGGALGGQGPSTDNRSPNGNTRTRTTMAGMADAVSI